MQQISGSNKQNIEKAKHSSKLIMKYTEQFEAVTFAVAQFAAIILSPWHYLTLL